MVIDEMSKEDCTSMLAQATLGRLACAHENRPYIVPINFVFEDTYLYGFTTQGQKIDWMRTNPYVCIEVDKIENVLHWTSILVYGRYEELTDTVEVQSCAPPRGRINPSSSIHALSDGPSLRAHAHELLQSCRGSWWEPGCTSSILRHAKEKIVPIYYRICIEHMTGRRATSDS